MKFVIFVYIMFKFIKNSLQSSALDKNSNLENNSCSNPCNVCQSSIYTLKTFSKIDCLNTECPQICTGLRNDFLSQKNIQLSIFRNNQLTVCETCFRLNLCHMSECIQQKSIIKNSISSTLQNTQLFHKILSDQVVIDELNKLPSDLSFNINLIFTNGNRLMTDVLNYINLFYYSESLKKIYFNFYERITNEKYEIINQNVPSFSYDESITAYDEFFKNNENLDSLFQNYKIRVETLENFYKTQLINARISISPERLYNSFILNEEQYIIDKYTDFNIKMKNLIDEIFSFIEYLNVGIKKNIFIIGNIKKSFFNKNIENSQRLKEEPAIVLENTIDKKKQNPKKKEKTRKEKREIRNTEDLFKSSLDNNYPLDYKNSNKVYESYPKLDTDKINKNVDEIEAKLAKLNSNYENLTKGITGLEIEEDPLDTSKRKALNINLYRKNGFDDINAKRERLMKKNNRRNDEHNKQGSNKEEEQRKFRILLKKTYQMLLDFNKNALTNKNPQNKDVQEDLKTSTIIQTNTIEPVSENSGTKTLNATIKVENLINNSTVVTISSNNTNEIEDNSTQEILIDKMNFNELQKFLEMKNRTFANTTKDSIYMIEKEDKDIDSNRINGSVFSHLFLEKKLEKIDKDLNNLRNNNYPNILN